MLSGKTKFQSPGIVEGKEGFCQRRAPAFHRAGLRDVVRSPVQAPESKAFERVENVSLLLSRVTIGSTKALLMMAFSKGRRAVTMNRASRSDQLVVNKKRRGTGPATTLSLLKSFIESGHYAPGMALPTERALAEKLGVGRPAIRESIKALTILDVLESRRGDGTYLKSMEGLRAGWPAQVELSTRDFSMLDLLEVRKMFEPKAAKLAASRAVESHLRRIESQRIKVKEAKNWDAVAQRDLLLHTAIIEAAGNPILSELNSALTRLLHRSRQITGARAQDRSQMLNAHNAIVDAILKGDGDEAEKAMLEHLHQVGLDLISDRKRLTAQRPPAKPKAGVLLDRSSRLPLSSRPGGYRRQK